MPYSKSESSDLAGENIHREAAKGNCSTVQWITFACKQRIDKKNEYSQTALHIAAAEGYINIMSVLLKAGADPNARDAIGQTPLHEAASAEQEAAVELLLKYQADPNLKDQYGKMPFQVTTSETVKQLLVPKPVQAVSIIPNQISQTATAQNNAPIAQQIDGARSLLNAAEIDGILRKHDRRQARKIDDISLEQYLDVEASLKVERINRCLTSKIPYITNKISNQDLDWYLNVEDTLKSNRINRCLVSTNPLLIYRVKDEHWESYFSVHAFLVAERIKKLVKKRWLKNNFFKRLITILEKIPTNCEEAVQDLDIIGLKRSVSDNALEGQPSLKQAKVMLSKLPDNSFEIDFKTGGTFFKYEEKSIRVNNIPAALKEELCRSSSNFRRSNRIAERKPQSHNCSVPSCSRLYR